MTVRLLLTLFSLFLCGVSVAKERPKLAVVIIADGLRYDQFIKYAPNFSREGFQKLTKEGVMYTNARHSGANATAQIGIAAIMTGTTAAAHGVVGENIVNYTTNEINPTVEDKRHIGIGALAERGMVSPRNLVIESLGDQLKQYSDSSKVISIGTRQSDAIIAAGVNPDGAYWLDTLNLWWATSSYYTKELPKWLETLNKGDLKNTISNKQWKETLPKERYFNKQSDVLFRSGNFSAIANLFRSKDAEYSKMANTPLVNDFLFSVAKSAIEHENLGKDSNTDLLILSVSGIADLNAKYGIGSAEVEDAYYKLDMNIAELITLLNKQCGKDNYVIVFTSPCGSSDNIPLTPNERTRSGRLNKLQFKIMMNSFLSTQFGHGDWIVLYNDRQIYLNRKLIFERNLSLKEVQAKCAAFAIQFKGVANASTQEQLTGSFHDGGVLFREAMNYNQKFSGDIVITLLPGWIEGENEDDRRMSAPGSGYDYDVHVPLMFYGKELFPRYITRDVSITDIAPTLCELLQIGRSDASQGRVLTDCINNIE